MRFAFLVTLAIPALALAQATQQSAPLNESRAFSIWAARHEATAKFADIAVQRATNGDVKQFAEKLVKEERDALAGLTKEAEKEKIEITAVGRDTTDALLAAANAALGAKSGKDFDGEWVARANAWMTTLILDNNINVSGKLPEGDLKKMSQSYSRFQFRLSAEARSLQGKLK